VIVRSSLSNWVAGLTISLGLPLYFTTLIRDARFPQGLPFVVMYTWGLVAVVVLPIALLMQGWFLMSILKTDSKDRARESLLKGIFALCFGVLGQCVFLLMRH
jgi:formate/nitrite transporter FocA (FNT family)